MNWFFLLTLALCLSVALSRSRAHPAAAHKPSGIPTAYRRLRRGSERCNGSKEMQQYVLPLIQSREDAREGLEEDAWPPPAPPRPRQGRRHREAGPCAPRQSQGCVLESPLFHSVVPILLLFFLRSPAVWPPRVVGFARMRGFFFHTPCRSLSAPPPSTLRATRRRSSRSSSSRRYARFV